ncbi:ABC transporter permease [Micromonospora sp. NBC_01699]|uniref:ABC transporter permease n=1 Tax=Micromonospora sp. NBC_01699 TaxID=2975984 RepID=UPI002E36B45A|nr:ABC transporter permease [Micromonospora sp. NBC_01699]
MLRATLKSLLARKVRLVLSGLAVVLGVMFVAGSFVLTDTLGRSFDSVFSDAYAATDVNVAAKPKIAVNEFEGEQLANPLPATTLDAVRQVPGVAEATGVVATDGARLIGSNGKVVTSFGPPQLGENWTGENELLKLREGRAPTAENEIVVNVGLAKAAKVKVGDRVGVLVDLAPKQEFTLVGVFGFSGDRDSLGGLNEVAFTTPVAQRLMLGAPNVFTNISIRAQDGVDQAVLRDRVAAAVGDGYEVKTGKQLSADSSAGLKEGLAFFNQILLGFAGVALLVGTFLILNTFSIIVAQRTRELALMRAIGASGKQVIRSVLVEALAIGLVASVLGLGAGIGVGALLAYAFGQFGGGGLELAGVGVPPIAVISSFAVGILITVVAALIPAVRASRIPPIAAMQDVATPDRPLTKLTVAGAVVSVLGAGLLTLGLTGAAGDAILGTILGGVLLAFIGVALLTPVISRPVVALLGRIFSWSVPGKLGRLNSGRNPRRTAITAAALMIGIALVTGVTIILDSAKSSISGLAEDTISADLVISGAQSGPRPPTFDEAVLDRAAALPGVKAVAGFWGDMALVNGQREYVNATSDVPAMRDIYRVKATAGSVDSLTTDQVLVDADTARKLNLTVGSTVPVQLSRGEPHTYTVSGVYAPSELYGGFLLPREATKDFAIPRPSQGYLQLDSGATVAQVLPKVESLLADSPEVSVADRASFIKQQTGQFDTLLRMIQILLALAILIAVLGIVNTLALSVLERTRELGLLRAIGLNRAGTMWMVTVEAVVISVFGALLGMAVGTGLGAAVVRALRDDGITDLVLPWAQLGVLIALAAVVGVVAAVLPAIRAARINVLGAIAHE